MLNEGEKVGAFEVASSTGDAVSGEGLAGRAYVAFFYPKSFTPGCTIETRNFATSYPDFQDAGVEVLGVSNDKLERQCSFAEKMGASFPILDDTSKAVGAAFGMKPGLLGTYKRMTFVVDEQGKVEKIYDVGAGVGSHTEEVLEYMTSRKAARG